MGDYGSSASTVASVGETAADAGSAASTAAEVGSAASSASDVANYAGSTGGDVLNYADATTAYPMAEPNWYDSIKSGLDNYQSGKQGSFGEFMDRFGESDNYGFNMENAGYIGGKLENVSKLGGGGGSATPAPMNVTNNMMQPNNDRYAQLYRLYSGRP